MKTSFTSKTGCFICNLSNLENDGCAIKLNPIHYGSHVSNTQIGFVTNDAAFFFDTECNQIEMDLPEIKELSLLIDEILIEISTH